MMHVAMSARVASNRRSAARKPAAANAAQAVAALQLLGRWQRVCSGHLSFTNGCACGVGATVDLAGLDDLILDYLGRKFSNAPALARFVTAHDVPGGIRSLLRALATASSALSAAEAGVLIAALESSVASIEEQHAL